MYKIRFILLIFLFSHSFISAQEQCGSDQLHQKLMQSDSVYKSNFFSNQNEIYKIIQNQSSQKKASQIYTIPVVVHVIHLGEPVGTGTNISDAQIQEAIKGLNDRYRNIEGNGSLDIEINFCLALRDPNGCPTNGINRVNGSSIPNYSSFGIQQGGGGDTCPGANEDSIKALSRWPYSDYYNIWVVTNICNGLWGGYAYFPSINVKNKDGTVIRAIYMTNGNYLLSHEIGHAFNLFHTFNGDGVNTACPTDFDCTVDGDRCCDTPPHKESDCGGSNPCTVNGIWDNSRLNYMSYCYSSIGRFTSDQKNRMQATMLVAPRKSLANSLGCTPSSFSTTVTANGPTTFCQGDSVTLNSSTANSYSWSSGATSQSINVSTSGNFSVIVLNDSGCLVISPIVTVSVNPIPPAPTISAGSVTTFCNGGSVALTSNAVSGNTWYKDGILINGSTGTILNVSTGGSYTSKTILNNCESPISNTVVVSVNAIPPIANISSGSSTSFCSGGSVLLISNANNGNQWYKDGIEIQNSTASTLNVNTSGNYTSKVTLNGCQTASSNTINVIVNPIPPAPTISAGTSTSFCIGGSVILTSNAANGNAWYKDGILINGSTNSTLNVNSGGSYNSKTILNGCESPLSAPIVVTVNPLPTQPGTITGNNNVLLAQTLDYTISSISGATGYNWVLSGGGNIINGQNSNTTTIYWTTAGSYTLTVNSINACGNGPTQTLNITVSVGTGIVNPDDQFQIKLVPNPSQGEFYFTAKGLLNKNIKIDVLNNLGQTIYRTEQKALSNDFYKLLDLSKFPDGIYNVRILVDKKYYLRRITKINR